MLVAAGCMSSTPALTKVGSPPYLAGSGLSASETRPLEPFGAIEATSAVRVELVAGQRDEAVVTTDDNLLSAVVTEVRDDTLVITIEGSIETRLVPVIVVTATRPVASLTLQASAQLTVEDLELDRLSASLSSAARLDASGRVRDLDLVVLAASTADLRELAVETADVTVSSASTAYVRASLSVKGTCQASSKLLLVGEPASRTVQADVSSEVVVE
jgi:hypothetical protein